MGILIVHCSGDEALRLFDRKIVDRPRFSENLLSVAGRLSIHCHSMALVSRCESTANSRLTIPALVPFPTRLLISLYQTY